MDEYCRARGLFPEQVRSWRAVCEQACSAKADRQRIRELEKNLGRKDRALAETAALLILREKAAVTRGDEAVETGARRFRACAERGLGQRTYRRWTAQEGTVKADGRPEEARPTPANALSEEERQKRIPLSGQPEFARLPESQIAPLRADRGEYYASASRFYRVLKADDLQHHRGRAAAPRPSEPKRHRATRPNPVWVRDITGLPGRYSAPTSISP